MQTDDELTRFAAQGAPLLPTSRQGFVEHDGARIWYAAYGAAPTVILLHGGPTAATGYQLPALLAAGYGVLVIDSRGHGRSTRDARPYRYDRMADDLLAVMDALRIPHAAGGLATARYRRPSRRSGWTAWLQYGSNRRPPIRSALLRAPRADYAASPTPQEFDEFVAAVSLMMSSQPNYTAQELAAIRVPVTVVHSEHDEFIRAEHAAYLSGSIPAPSGDAAGRQPLRARCGIVQPRAVGFSRRCDAAACALTCAVLCWRRGILHHRRGQHERKHCGQAAGSAGLRRGWRCGKGITHFTAVRGNGAAG